MNRRSFIERLAKAAAGFTILPAATTYQRVWKKQRYIWVIDWEDIEIGDGKFVVDAQWECVLVPPEKVLIKSYVTNALIDGPGWIENFSNPVNA